MSRDLHDLELRLEAGKNDCGLLAVSFNLLTYTICICSAFAFMSTFFFQEIEVEIAKRQADINALNEQAEELTERDTPPIESGLLQINQLWVGIRSKVENCKPTNGIGPHKETNGVSMSPPMKQKYEYAVINKNRKNKTETSITKEIAIEQQDSPIIEHKNMTLDFSSSTANTDALFITSPSHFMPSPSKSSPGSGIDVDDESIAFDNMTQSTSSKKSIVTDLDEAAKSASEGNLTDTGSDITLQTDADNQQTVEEALAVIRTLLSRAAILDKQLSNSDMDIDQYTHSSFSNAQDILQVISYI